MKGFRQIVFVSGLLVFLSACGISEIVTFENSKYSEIVQSKNIDSIKYKEFLLNNAYYVVRVKESGYGVYKIWLVKVGSAVADNKVVIDRVLIKLADKTVSHVLGPSIFEKAFDANYELLLLYDLDFNQEPFKSVATQSPMYVHVTFKVNGVEQTKVYNLERVVQKMIIYPT